jgi:hypothetical protein
MKKLLENALRAFQDARARRINERALVELDAQTLRDIGFHDGVEQARIEALRRRLQFGLY